MAININKRKLDFEIIIDDDHLKNAGFEKISINNRDMVASFVNRRPVLCKFKIDDLTGTLKSLRKELVNKGIDKQSVQRLEIFLSEKLIQKQKELEAQKEEETTPAGDLERIREEIENYRQSIGQISMEQWQAGVFQRYHNLINAVKSNLPSLWSGLEFVLSAKPILNIKG